MQRFRVVSVPVLSLLGAGALTCHGAHLASAGQQNTPKPGKPTVAQTGKSKPAPQTPADAGKLQIGDVTIDHAITMDVDFNKSHLVGPNTEIVVPDKASKSVLTVHADDIQASRAGAANFSLIILSGNVRYRLVQKTEEGERILNGTAGHAVLRRTTQQMEFTEDVHAKLTDPARFSGPALLHTGSLNVAMETKPFRYNLAGDAANNDIRFTPLQSHAAQAGAKPEPPTPLGPIHLFGFRTGELQVGKSIHLQGAGTTCDFASVEQKTVWHLVGYAFEGEFVPDRSDLQRATVTDNVQFHVLQPASDKKDAGEQILDGTAGRAVLRRTTQQMEFTGGVHAKLTDKARFSGPATLRTGSLNVAMENKPYRYNLVGDSANNDILFTPLQSPAATVDTKPGVPVAKADAKPEALIPVGAIHIFGFRTGELQVGKSFHMQGAGSTGDFATPDKKTAWHLTGDAIEGEFLPDQADLQRATVTDNVQFHILQPSADKTSGTIVDGTASKASYLRTQTGQETVLHWPIKATFLDPVQLAVPGHLTAGEGATVTLKETDAGFSYHIEDPKSTTHIDITPKMTEANAPKPVVPPVPK